MLKYEWRPGHPIENDDVYDSTEINNQNPNLILLPPILQPIQNNYDKNDDNILNNNANTDANKEDNNLVHPYQGAMTKQINNMSLSEQHSTHEKPDQNQGAD